MQAETGSTQGVQGHRCPPRVLCKGCQPSFCQTRLVNQSVVSQCLLMGLYTLVKNISSVHALVNEKLRVWCASVKKTDTSPAGSLLYKWCLLRIASQLILVLRESLMTWTSKEPPIRPLWWQFLHEQESVYVFKSICRCLTHLDSWGILSFMFFQTNLKLLE